MPTFRELLAFASGVIATSLLTTLPGWEGWNLSKPAAATPSLASLPVASPSTSPVPTEEVLKNLTRNFQEVAQISTNLDQYINQLENLTVRRTWTSEILGQVKSFREKRESFGNKADFATMSHVMRYYDKEGGCDGGGSPAIVLLAGANKGTSTSQVLQACRKAKMHIFEIQSRLYEVQKKRFQDSDHVTVHRKGWSDSVQHLQITMPHGAHEQAGLFLPVGKWKHADLLNETVDTIPLADFIAQENLDRISYVIIDVEGKEPNVIRGMRLESHRRNFPVFQFELGGTWTDSRHDENQWSQFGIAMYLTALGYNLFIMGEKGEMPMLLRVEPEFFRIYSFRPEVDVGGNLLALHPEFADGLQTYLQRFVQAPKTLQGCNT